MTVFPRAVLFPDWRPVVGWGGVAVWFAFLLLLTFRDETHNAVVLCAAVTAALWAADCVRRMRRWQANTLVPGYAATVLLTAVGIVVLAVALAAIVVPLTGVVFGIVHGFPVSIWWAPQWEPPPVLGLAAVGLVVLAGIAGAPRPIDVPTVPTALACVALATVFTTSRWDRPAVSGTPVEEYTMRLLRPFDVSGLWHVLDQPAFQWTAAALAVAAVTALGRSLARPGKEPVAGSAARGAHFRPFIIGPGSALSGGMSTMLLVAAVVAMAIPAYGPFDGASSLAAMAIGLLVFLGSLTPLLLLGAAGAWLSTAWQLGMGGTRRSLGRLFAFRVAAVTSASFGLAFAAALVHALFAMPNSQDHIDEALLLYAVGLGAFAAACWARPRRATRQPSHIGALAVVCVAALAVSFNPLSLQAGGRSLLGLTLVAAAGLAVLAGGRAISRVDFLPTTGR